MLSMTTNREMMIRLFRVSKIYGKKSALLGRDPDFGGRTIKSFSGFKGLLKIPVNGRIASGYGRYA
jgi:hypothetical protein